MERRVRREVEGIEEMGRKGLEKLWNLLKGNRVYQQEELLKLKSGYEKSKDYLPKYYE